MTGRAWGNAVFEGGDLIAPSTDKITGLSGTDLIVVVFDPLAAR